MVNGLGARGPSWSVGLTNGLTNGRMSGKTNGLTNGRVNGKTNGRGATNGRKPGIVNGGMSAGSRGLTNGFVNGSGAVNGFRLSYQQRRIGEVSLGLSRKLAVISILVSFVVATPYALVYLFPKKGVEIDGYFTDWLDAQMYADLPDYPNPDISIVKYAMKFDGAGSYFFVSTQGRLFEGREGGADAFFIFIDTDDKATSGYSVRGIGADALIFLTGWNRTLVSAATYAFDQHASRSDFSGFRSVSWPSVAIDGSRMEVGSSVAVNARSKAVVCAKHTNESGDWSDVNFRARGPAVQVVVVHDAPDVLDPLTEQPVLTIRLTSKGSSARIDGLRFDFLGNATPLSLKAREGDRPLGVSTGDLLLFSPSLHLAEGESREIRVFAELSPEHAGWSFGLALNRTAGLVADERNITWTVKSEQTGARVAYISHPPSGVAIDGAFADWSTKAEFEDVLGDAYSEAAHDNSTGDVDIRSVSTASAEGLAFFFMSVNGTMLGGASVPKQVVRVLPGPPAQNVSNITLPMHGADFAFVFIDLDQNQSTGFYVGGSEVSIAVIGKGNSILSSRAYSYAHGQWTELGPVSAAIDSWRLEVAAPYSELGLLPGKTYTLTFLTQDWSGREDGIAVPLPARINAGTRAYPGIIINEVYNKAPPNAPNDWIELYNTADVPISLEGWQLYVDGFLVYTFPAITLQPGEIRAFSGLDFGKGQVFVLTDASGAIVDSVTCPAWQERSYGRTGSPPYSNWSQMTPTPNEINVGQYPIPEFGNIVMPLAIVPIIMIAIRQARKRAARRA